MRAKSTNGIALQAICPGGYALDVNGRFHFNRSGKVTIPAGSSSRTISGHADDIRPESLVLATIQGNVPGLYVRAVSASPGDSFTIRLNRAAPQDVK